MSGAADGLGPCLLVVLSFLEGCGPLDWLSHLHLLPIPLSSSLQGKKSPRVFGLGLRSCFTISPWALSYYLNDKAWFSSTVPFGCSVKREG